MWEDKSRIPLADLCVLLFATLMLCLIIGVVGWDRYAAYYGEGDKDDDCCETEEFSTAGPDSAQYV